MNELKEVKWKDDEFSRHFVLRRIIVPSLTLFQLSTVLRYAIMLMLGAT